MPSKVNEKIFKVLSELGKKSSLEESRPHNLPHEDQMLAITPDTGAFYNIFLKALSAKRVLEVGTSIGYSTLWFVEAILKNIANPKTERKPVITIEKSPSKIERAKKNFKEAGVNELIEVRQGPAKEILLKMLKDSKNISSFDFVFLDANKEEYTDYLDLVLPMLRVGGIIGADNMLAPKIFLPYASKYVEHIRKKENLQSVTVPIGKGQEITIKTKSDS